MTTGIPFLQYLQWLQSHVVNVCKGKTFQAEYALLMWTMSSIGSEVGGSISIS